MRRYATTRSLTLDERLRTLPSDSDTVHSREWQVSRYRKFEVKTWLDAEVRSMSAPEPNGQTLWHWLLTGQRTISIPGVVIARESTMAEDLGWSLEGFRKAFREVWAKGFVKVDWKVGLVLLRRGLIDSSGQPRESNRPANPNVLKSWAKSWDDIPECDLKDELLRTLECFSKALGERYEIAFRESFAKALAKRLGQHSPKQDQDQDQDQEQKQDQEGGPRAAARDPRAPTTTAPVPVQGADPDPRATERRAILRRVHAHHREVYERTRVAVRSDARPMGAVGDPAERALSKHLLELVTLETAEADCMHALAVAEAEAISKHTVKFLGASVWTPGSFAHALSTTPTEAGEIRRDDVAVGPYQPPPRSAYGNGVQDL